MYSVGSLCICIHFKDTIDDAVYFKTCRRLHQGAVRHVPRLHDNIMWCIQHNNGSCIPTRKETS